MVTDPIADLLTRIRNAVQARRQGTSVPYSKMKASLLDVMKKTNFISGYKVVESEANAKFKELIIEFNSDLDSLNLKRISKPGRRVYVKKDEISLVQNGYGISIFSTPRGVITGGEARKVGVGGEYLCEIW